MTRTEREQMIDRYLQGKLTPAEEQEFFIEAAIDKEMRYDLKASQVVENAIKKDRKMAPTSWGDTRTYLAAMLVAQNPNPVQVKAGIRTKLMQATTGVGGMITIVVCVISLVAILVSLVALDQVNERTLPIPGQANGPVPVQENPTVSIVQDVEEDSIQHQIDQTDSEGRSLLESKDESIFSANPPRKESSEDRTDVSQKQDSLPVEKEPLRADTINPDNHLQISIDHTN